MKILLALVATTLMVYAPVLADRPLATHIAFQPAAPVSVKYCAAREGDGSGGNGEDFLYLGFDTSAVAQPVNSIRVRFTLSSASGEDLSPDLPVLVTATGTYASGTNVTLSGNHAAKLANRWGDNIAVVTCSVDSVKYSDGATWSALPPMPSPTTSP